MECLYLGGGLGSSKWVGYAGDLTTASISAHICVQDSLYFTKDKIKRVTFIW